MRLPQTTLSPLLRSLAAVAFVVFIGAQTMCFVHCHAGGGHGDKVQPSCHGSPQHAASHDADEESAPSPPSPTAACSTFKAMLVGADAPALTLPVGQMQYLPAPTSLALDATATRPTALFSRQARCRKWVFAPEVCLGPAFRSLAPPFVG